jgi:hypothetical protein
MASRNMREEPATHHHGSRSKPREKSLRKDGDPLTCWVSPAILE